MISVDTNNEEKRKNKIFCSDKKIQEFFFIPFSPIFRVIGLQVQDELERTSPLHLACKNMIVDLVGWSQGAQNAEK